MNKNILWLRDVSEEDIKLVGDKGGNLGELTKAGLPVPPGFVVTTQAYFDFLKNADIASQIKKILSQIEPENGKKIHEAALKIQKLILSKPLPASVSKEIIKAYQELYLKGSSNIFVAVRSSATTEDLLTASFAGQQKTFLNVTGSDEVIKAVKKCWAALYEARAIYYRMVNRVNQVKIGMAVSVQKMVQADKSGVMFTADPITNDRDKIIIEAGFGLGEAIVSGAVSPDYYVIDKNNLQILAKSINKQNWKIVRQGKTCKHVSLSKTEQETQKISDQEIIMLAETGRKINEYYGTPQDIEWAIEGNNLFILQAKQVITINKDAKTEDLKTEEPEIVLTGIAAALGICSGPVRILHKPSEIDRVQKGDILVVETLTPAYDAAVRIVAAIVTDTGGQNSYSSIISRELGIPCVSGSGIATHVLKENQIISADGNKGLVYKGKINWTAANKPSWDPLRRANSGSTNMAAPITATKVYVEVDETVSAAKIGRLACDGVASISTRSIIAETSESVHSLIGQDSGDIFVRRLTEGLQKTCAAFSPRPVVYCLSDFKTNEHRSFKDSQELIENNPLIGYHGPLRHIKEPEMLNLELAAIKTIREKNKLKNLWIMVPFVRTVKEMEKIMDLISGAGLNQSSDFKIWLKIEVPANVILMERFCALGIDGVSIDVDNLAQLTLGIDGDNKKTAEDFDLNDAAVKLSISHVIKTAQKFHIRTNITGKTAITYPEIVELVTTEGATSVSVSPDYIGSTRKLLASIEKKILQSEII